MASRYENKFSVKWDIGNINYDMQIPKITLQPIVENAIYYGIKPFEHNGIIYIKIFTKNNNLIITVSDTGKGFSEHSIEQINEELKNNYIKEDFHIGISNVNMRIKLLYGESYGITVGNSKKGGGKITITLPQ